jgi:hypothetical protein
VSSRRSRTPIDRRTVLGRLAVGGAALGLQGHTPYRQWEVFRKGRLVVVATAEDPAAVRLAEAVAAVLVAHLPESRALMTRASQTRDLLSLLATRQLDVALLAAEHARAAVEGRAPAGQPIPLRAIVALGTHLLVCREEVPAARVLEIVRALAEHWKDSAPPDVAPPTRPDPAAPPPPHAAAREYWQDRAPVTPAAR